MYLIVFKLIARADKQAPCPAASIDQSQVVFVRVLPVVGQHSLQIDVAAHVQ